MSGSSERQVGRRPAGLRRRAEDTLSSSLARRYGEDGQALILVLIIIMLVVTVVPIVVTQSINEATTVSLNSDFEAALAAAEAGVQQYRNLMDLYPNYYEYNSTTNPLPSGNVPADPALTPTGWETVAKSSPPEAFHYIPGSQPTVTTGAGTPTAQVLLTVTGRAGPGPNPNNYVYRTIQVELQSSGVLTNAYFSKYEVEDPAQNTNIVCVTPSGVSTSTCQTTANGGSCTGTAPCNGSADYSAGSSTVPQLENGKTYWQSLCGYDDWQPNTFIDEYSATVSAIDDVFDHGTPFNQTLGSSGVNYFGPYRGSDPDYITNGGADKFQTFSNSSGQQFTATNPCNGIYNFASNETFSGPVYSQDQLWVCGTPSFEGGLTSGVPTGFTYNAGWPTQNGSTSGTDGWIDDGPVAWDNDCGPPDVPTEGATSSPNFNGVPLQQNGKQSLPPLNTAIEAAANCLYTGPTMIEFVPDGTFNVWSPLTTNPGTGCATNPFSTTTPYQTGMTIPSSGLVIYVQNDPSGPSGTAVPSSLSNYINGSTTSPAGQDPAGAVPTQATCLDPWKPYASATPSATPPGPCSVSQATEGDAIVEGEVKGQVTVGAAANIIISRDLSYACAGGPTDTALPAACSTPGKADVLGLAANEDTVISKPGVVCTASQLPPGFTASSSCDDDQLPAQTEPYEWPAVATSMDPSGDCTDNGTESTPNISDVIPDCWLDNPEIDAAIVSLNGSFADEDWDLGVVAGDAYLQGTDISDYRGPFGQGSSNGYSKEFTYDSRLTYLTPPSLISVAALLWTPTIFVNCGNIDDANATASGDGNGGSAICPGIPGVG